MVSTSGSTVNNFLTDDTGAVLAFSSTVSGTTTSYVPIQDGMGSTVALVDQNGNLTNTYTYDPTGAVTKTGTVSFPYQYAGAEFDSQTGLYHVGSYYDPVLERVVSGATPTGAAGPNLAGGSGPIARSGGSGPNWTQGGIAIGEFAWNEAIGTYFAMSAADYNIGAALLAAFPPAAVIGAATFGFLDAFGIFDGGSPFIPYKLRVPAHSIQSGLPGSPGVILTQADEEEDPLEREVEKEEIRDRIFQGKRTIVPYGGLELKLDNGMTIFIPQGTEGKPADNGRGVRFPWGD